MKELNYNQLLNMIEPGKKHPVLVNVLPKEDFLKTHIPGSINLPVEKIEAEASRLFAKHDWIVVYCANKNCDASHQAAEKFKKLGFENVYRFTGGCEEWTKNKNYTCTEKSQKKTIAA